MRTITWILLPGLLALWGWFALTVAPGDARRPVAVAIAPDAEELSAEALNNRGVLLDRQGRPADALAHFERARDFRPQDPRFVANVERAERRLEQRGWLRFLGPSSALAVLVLIVRGVRGAIDRVRLARLRTRGESFVRIRPGDRLAEIPLRFNAPVKGLLSRNPLTVVWSCAGQGKHMKSRPPVRTDGEGATVRLEGKRIERLLRHPGDWRAFLYVGKTPVGEAAARVG